MKRMKRFRRLANLIVMLALAASLAGCGDSNYVKALINGQEYDWNVQGVDILASCGSGAGAAGYPMGGVGLSVTMYLSGGGYVSDSIALSVLNVLGLEPGVPVYVDGNNINSAVVLNGVPAQVFSGTVIFNSISNQPGRNVSGDFQLNLSGTFAGLVHGHFSSDVNAGC